MLESLRFFSKIQLGGTHENAKEQKEQKAQKRTKGTKKKKLVANES